MEKKNKLKVTITRDTRTSLGIVRKGACMWLPASEAAALISVRVAEEAKEPEAHKPPKKERPTEG